MQYTKVRFAFNFATEWQRDVFLQGLADIGFESFEGDAAYVPSHLFNEDALRSYAQTDSQTIVGIDACDDTNWNAQWELEHGPVQLPYGIIIQPDGAFGAGDHATTSMLLNAIARERESMHGARVLDMGCGTGVLAIMAAKADAKEVIAIDIDERAVRSTIANATLNNVRLTAMQGDEPPQGMFNYIFANIHRNVITTFMHSFAERLTNGGKLFTSGFFEKDIPLIEECARKHGLTTIETTSDNQWISLIFRK